MKTIKPRNNNGSILLRFSVNSKVYSLNPINGGKYTNPIDLGKANAIATQISLDISQGNFDPTLERYKIKPNDLAHIDLEADKPLKPKYVLEVWDLWVETLNLPEATKNDHYEMVRRMILKAKKPTIDDITWLIPFRDSLSSSTFKKRLGYLKSCCNWAIMVGLYSDKNPYLTVKLTKSVSIGDAVKPFSKTEIKAILTALATNQFSSKFSVTPHSHYLPFVKFLFFTGVRTGEAIGLQWKHIDFEHEHIKICESLSIDRSNGGNGYRRLRKPTKTGIIRYLPCKNELKAFLLSIKPSNYDPEALVFPSPTGKHIDGGNFRERIWKPILEGLKIEYRNPYQTRHTLLTHAVMTEGIGVLGAAKLAGHKNARMVTQHYARFIDQPELPELI